MSYIIRNNMVVACTSTFVKSGQCEYSHEYSEDANFTKSLINLKKAEVSNSKVWVSEARQVFRHAEVIGPCFQRQFLISSLCNVDE